MDDIATIFEEHFPHLTQNALELIAKRDWLGLVNLPEDRAGYKTSLRLSTIWDRLSDEERRTLLIASNRRGDNPSLQLDWYREVLRDRRGLFAKAKDKAAFDALPDVVRLYRGTQLSEFTHGPLGVNWTNKRDTAAFYAADRGATLANRAIGDRGGQRIVLVERL
ncbi:MAG TPA: hypothetical protein VHW60_23835 [Caulobacteraceae bacterium]|jgi:hypothetical protein|nr:hypothetical protein [Caulobacteraceae bacterium]